MEPLRPCASTFGELIVAAPDETYRWVSGRFAHTLQAAADSAAGDAGTFSIRVVAASRAAQSSAAVPASPERDRDVFNSKYVFDQFVIGVGNRLAHAASLAVAELPGQAYNPLFICGAPGLGKTHLLHSIANYVRACAPELTVRYVTSDAFTNQFVHALRSGSSSAVDSFKQRYREADVLLVDDVQFLRSKVRTGEEFFHTFNALYETGAQIVLTSDRPPQDLQALEDRLRARFEAGLVTAIDPPDFDTRLTILRKRARHDTLKVADDSALEVLAHRIDTNIRALEGALIRVVALHSLTRRRIDDQLASEVLDALHPDSRPARRSVLEIQQATCSAFDLSLDELCSGTRAARVSWPRQIAMHLARQLTDDTLPAIGQAFGGRSHTTVLHACERTRTRMTRDRRALDEVNAIARQLQRPR